MSPFKPGDKIVIKNNITSHHLKYVVCTVKACYLHMSSREYVVSFVDSRNIYYARLFDKYYNRKDRIESLNL